MKSFLLGFSLMTLVFLDVQAHDPALTIGDRVPDLAIPTLTGSPILLRAASRHKLLIIDFWATWCSPCLHGLLTADSLQRQFKGRLEVLGVTYEPAAVLQSFWKRQPRFQQLAFPIVADDTLLHGYFPHRILPHEVWILDQRVVAITSHLELTAANIELALRGQLPTNFYVKRDALDFDFTKPFDTEGRTVLSRSTLSRTPSGITNVSLSEPSNTKFQKGFRYQRLFFAGRPALDLFVRAAYAEDVSYTNIHRFVLRVKDTVALLSPDLAWKLYGLRSPLSYRAWQDAHSYTYELIVGARHPDTLLYRHMLDDLNQSLPYEGRLEYQLLSCWVVVQDSAAPPQLATRGGPPRVYWQPGASGIDSIRQISLDQLFRYINYYSGTDWILNETGYHLPVDLAPLALRFQAPTALIDQLQLALRRYGLRILRTERRLPMLVISDKE